MPWEITIRRIDEAPLGEMAEVRRQISTALPAVTFRREPSGAEKIATARAAGVEFPEVLRRHLEQRPATEQAEFEGPGFSMRLYGFETQPIRSIHAEIRGDGDPIPALTALCQPDGWVVVDDASGRPVDLSSGAAAGWEAFREYRDGAIRHIEGSSPP